MWILARMAGLVDAPAVSRVSLRAALVAGPVVFLAAGFADFALAEGFLTYPAGWEKPVIIVIETAMTLTVAVTLAIAATVIRRGDALEYALGGWAPPLGVLLRADGLSVAMLLTTAIVIGAAGLYARSDFGVPRGGLEARAPLAFWALLLTAWAGLNAAFLALGSLHPVRGAGTPHLRRRPPGQSERTRGDAQGRPALPRLRAALGSALFLLGVALLYGSSGTLDIALLAERVRVEPAAQVALATLGAAAILVGSVLALRQARLKMLVAYSTVAQIGYLFLIFPLASATQIGAAVWTGAMQAVSHALAKASMFLAAGLIAKAIGHDRIADMGGIGRILPTTLIAFGLAGFSRSLAMRFSSSDEGSAGLSGISPGR